MNCPIPNCTRTTRPGELLCTPHWRLVPSAMKDRVWGTWRVLRFETSATGPLPRQAYRKARDAAIAHVVELEGATL